MEPIIYIAIFNILILTFAFITKKGLYTLTPEKQWSKAIKAFNRNKKAIDNLDLSGYKLGSSHLYE